MPPATARSSTSRVATMMKGRDRTSCAGVFPPADECNSAADEFLGLQRGIPLADQQAVDRPQDGLALRAGGLVIAQALELDGVQVPEQRDDLLALEVGVLRGRRS